MEIVEFNSSKENFERLAELWNDVDHLIPGTLNSGIKLNLIETQKWYEQRKVVKAYIAVKDDRIVGYIDLLHSDNENSVFLGWTCIHPDYVKRLLSLKLYSSVMDFILNKNNILKIETRSWPSHHAIKFYKQFGMKWVPNTSAYFVNYLPLIIHNPLFKEFFKENEIIRSHIPRSSLNDDMEWLNGRAGYFYQFKGKDNVTLRVFIDIEIEQITYYQISDEEVYVSLEPNNSNLVFDVYLPRKLCQGTEQISVTDNTGVYYPIKKTERHENKLVIYVLKKNQSIATYYRFRIAELMDIILVNPIVKQEQAMTKNRMTLAKASQGIEAEYGNGLLKILVEGITFYTQSNISCFDENGRKLYLVWETVNSTQHNILLKAKLLRGYIYWEIEQKSNKITQKLWKDISDKGVIVYIDSRFHNPFGKLYFNHFDNSYLGNLIKGEFPIVNALPTLNTQYCIIEDQEIILISRWQDALMLELHEQKLPFLIFDLSKDIQWEIEVYEKSQIPKSVLEIMSQAKLYNDFHYSYLFDDTNKKLTVKIQTESILQKVHNASVVVTAEGDNWEYKLDEIYGINEIEKTYYFKEVPESFPIKIEFNVNNIINKKEFNPFLSSCNSVEWKTNDSFGSLEFLHYKEKEVSVHAINNTYGPFAPFPGGLHPCLTYKSAPHLNLLQGTNWVKKFEEKQFVEYCGKSDKFPGLDISVTYIRNGDSLLGTLSLINNSEQVYRELLFTMNLYINSFKLAKVKYGDDERIIRPRSNLYEYIGSEIEVELENGIELKLHNQQKEQYLMLSNYDGNNISFSRYQNLFPFEHTSVYFECLIKDNVVSEISAGKTLKGVN